MKNQLPNILTFLNLLSGCIATVLVLQGGYEYIPLCLLFVAIAAIFDFLDGLAARLLKVTNIIGKDLDSLADCISFGLVPGAVVFVFLQKHIDLITVNSTLSLIIPYFAFLLSIFSAWRLAKFNNDTRQTDAFIGLNTPANTIFWVSFCAGISVREMSGDLYITSGLIYTVLIGIVVFSILMVSELHMFSLKVKSIRIKGNVQRYLLLLFVLCTFPILNFLSLAGCVLLYIAMSIGNSKFKTR